MNYILHFLACFSFSPWRTLRNTLSGLLRNQLANFTGKISKEPQITFVKSSSALLFSATTASWVMIYLDNMNPRTSSFFKGNRREKGGGGGRRERGGGEEGGREGGREGRGSWEERDLVLRIREGGREGGTARERERERESPVNQGGVEKGRERREKFYRTITPYKLYGTRSSSSGSRVEDSLGFTRALLTL